MTPTEENKYKRARKRIEEIKGFYIHLSVYLVINAAILFIIFIATRDKGENFWEAGPSFSLSQLKFSYVRDGWIVNTTVVVARPNRSSR
jgi:hypothetical protein